MSGAAASSPAGDADFDGPGKGDPKLVGASGETAAGERAFEPAALTGEGYNDALPAPDEKAGELGGRDAGGALAAVAAGGGELLGGAGLAWALAGGEARWEGARDDEVDGAAVRGRGRSAERTRGRGQSSQGELARIAIGG